MRILTWLQATADQLHIWNYFWAIRPMLDLIDEYSTDPQNSFIVFIANLHSINTVQNWPQLSLNTYNLVKSYLAFGLDPKKVHIYKQSDIPAHAQLKAVFEALTTFGFMKRMHKYKDFVQAGKEEELNVGTFSYPILMAADILLYDADLVPVGKDNKQHMEFARDIAEKFNFIYWETFKLPKPLIREELATIPWIDGRKMSKSYNNFIGIFDSEEVLLKKVKSIVTQAIPVEDPKNPDEDNIYNILKLFLSPEEDATIRQQYQQWGLAFKVVKDMLYEKLLAFLLPIQKREKEITDEEINRVLRQWAEYANSIASPKILDVNKKVGL